jgi:hypothetical protein
LSVRQVVPLLAEEEAEWAARRLAPEPEEVSVPLPVLVLARAAAWAQPVQSLPQEPV